MLLVSSPGKIRHKLTVCILILHISKNNIATLLAHNKLYSKMRTFVVSLLASVVSPVFCLCKNKAFKSTFHLGTLYSVPGSKPRLTLILTCDAVSPSSSSCLFSCNSKCFSARSHRPTALTPRLPSVRLSVWPLTSPLCHFEPWPRTLAQFFTGRPLFLSFVLKSDYDHQTAA